VYTFNRLSNPFDNRFDNRLYRVYSRLSNRLYNRFDNRLYRANGVLGRKGSLYHIVVSDISLKLDTLGYISVAENLDRLHLQPLLRSAPRKLPNSVK